MAELIDHASLRRSPLAHLTDRLDAALVTGSRGVSLSELSFVTMVNLRVDASSVASVRVAEFLGAALPLRCGHTTHAGEHTVIWQGPDEWLVVSRSEAGALVEGLRDALDGGPGSVVDVSANRTTLVLCGPAARHVLEKGCSLDLHPRSFAPGTAVSTQIGPVPVVLWQVDNCPTYRILPRASYADYLARWLVDAMGEFGRSEVP